MSMDLIFKYGVQWNGLRENLANVYLNFWEIWSQICD